MILDSFLETVQRTVLPNGLTLLVREDRTSDVVAIETWVKAGYFHEPDEVAGMAHLFEHMFFKGSKNFPGSEEIARHLSRLGGVTNAGTIYDATSYYFVLPAEEFERAVEIQADAIRNPLFDPAELARETEVVIEESNRKLDNPLAVTVERLHATAFTDHRIKRWRIGSNDVLRNIRRDDLLSFFETLYRPENIIVAVVGAVASDRVIETVARTFGAIPRGELRKERGPAEPPQRTFRFNRSSADLTQSWVAFGWHTPGEGSDEDVALEMLTSTLGSGRCSRLYRGVVGPGGANTVSGWNSVFEDVGIFTLLASADPDNLEEVESRIIREIGRAVREKFSESEIEIARNKIKASQVFALEEVLGQAETLAWFESRGSYRDISKRFSRLDQTTSRELHEAASRYLDLNNLTVFRHEPAGREASEEGIFERLEDAYSADGTALGADEAREGSTSLPILAASASKPFQRFVLSNGATLFVRENPARPTVTIAVGIRGGRIFENSSNAGLTSLMARSMRRGTETRTASVLDREVEALGSRIGMMLEEDYFGFSINVLRQHVGRALELVSDVVLHPSFPEDEIERERQLQRAAIRRTLDSSSARPMQMFFEAFYRNHPYGLPEAGFESSLEAITPKALRDWYRESVVADGSIIVVVGDVSSSDVAERMEQSLGALPKSGLSSRVVPALEPYFPREVMEVRDRRQTAIVIGFPTVPPEHPDWIALRLLQSVMSGLAGTLFKELRGERSLCYTVYAGDSSRARAGSFVGYIASDATKETAAREGLLAEFRKMANDGPEADDVARAKSYLAGSTRIRLQTNASIAGDVMENYIYGLGLDFTDRMIESARLLRAEDLREVAKKWLGGDNYTVATLRGSMGGEDG